MISLVLMVLFIFYIVLLFLAATTPKTWKARLLLVCLLLAPLIYKAWDYPVLYFQYQQVCREQGGLKIIVQPHKADRLRLDGNGYSDHFAKSLLLRFPKNLIAVEVKNASSHEKDEYFSYSIDPATLGGAKQDVQFIKDKAQDSSDGVYLISRSESSDGAHRSKTEWKLTKNGKLYAKWTSFNYVWGFALFGSPIGWQCFDATTSHKYADEELTKIVVK